MTKRATTDTNGTSSTTELADEFERLRRRAIRQKRAIDESFDAWQHWSSTIDDAMAIVEMLASTPALNVNDLTAKFTAILKAIEFNSGIADAGDMAHLRRFGRDLNRLQRGRWTTIAVAVPRRCSMDWTSLRRQACVGLVRTNCRVLSVKPGNTAWLIDKDDQHGQKARKDHQPNEEARGGPDRSGHQAEHGARHA